MRRAIVLTKALHLAKKESELVAINERLSLALQNSSQIAFDWHIDEDTLFFSGSLTENLKGIPLDTSRTWNSSALPSIIHKEDLPGFRLHLHEALKGQAGTPDVQHQAEVRLKDAVHTWRWVNVIGQVTERTSDGRAVRMAGTFSDVHERKCAEKRTERLHRVCAMLSRTSQAIVRIRDRNLLFKEICRIAIDHGHFSAAWIELTGADGLPIREVAAHGRRAGRTTLPAHSCALSIKTEGRHQDDSSGPDDISHFIGRYTFHLQGVPYGILNLEASERDGFDDQLCEMLETLAKDLSFAINSIEREVPRKARENVLMESEDLLSTTLTLPLDCIVSINRNGEILSFNKSAEITFGVCSSDVLGKKLADVIAPPAQREQLRKKMEHLLANDECPALSGRIALNGIHSDGSTFPVELAIVPIRLNDQPIFTAFIRDISEYERSQAKLKEHATSYRRLLESSPQATFVCQDNKIVLLNQAARRLLGATRPSELLGRDILEFVCAEDHAFITAQACPRPDHGQPGDFVEQEWRRTGGHRFNAEVCATSLIHNDAPSVQLVVRDITERKRAEALQLGQNRILNMVATGSLLPAILDEISHFAEDMVNGMSCEIQQQSADNTPASAYFSRNLKPVHFSSLGNRQVWLSDHIHSAPTLSGAPSTAKKVAESSKTESSRTLPCGLAPRVSRLIVGKDRKPLGRIAFHSQGARRPTNFEFEVLRVCAELAGIAIESRASEERIRYLAHYDGLTSLPNRFLFQEYLDLALRNAQRNRKKFAVLFLDLDRFKEINDTLGHDAGDIVLREIARRMRSCLRHNDKIARMGGDEFYVLLEDMMDGVDAADVAQKLLDAASRPIHIGDHECHLSVSIGISIYPDNGVDGNTLVANADKAMYCAKDQGKNAFCFFSPCEVPDKSALALRQPIRMNDKSRLRLV